MAKHVAISDGAIINKIYIVRGQRVMLDRDMAELYGVETKALKRAVKRNIERFPPDFMFEMSPVEVRNWRRQFGTSNFDKMGLRYAPYCFTEQGIAMLSSVLTSKTAADVNVRIIRVFTRMRKVLGAHKDILLKLERLEKKITKHGVRLGKQESDMRAVFQTLKSLLELPPPRPMRRIGFRQTGK